MKKKYAGIVLLLMFTFALLLCGYNMPSGVIEDTADLFTEQEEAYLNQEAVRLSQEFNTQVAIATLTEEYGDSIEDFTKRYYEANGIGDGNGGILLLIDIPGTQNRKYYVYHSQGYINNSEAEEISSEIKPYLISDDYYDAAQLYLQSYGEYAADRQQGGGGSFLDSIVIRLLIAAGCSGIIVLIMVLTRNHDFKPSGDTYLGRNGVRINRQSDNFSHTTVITRKIERPNSGGGGQNTNDSGGAGGSF